MTHSYDPTDRSSIRLFMREQRNQLSDQAQLESAKRLSQQILAQPWYQRAQNIGIYVANHVSYQVFIPLRKISYGLAITREQ